MTVELINAQAVTTLHWRASTRLVVHFVDYPCHGSIYHNERNQAWAEYDRFADGDPDGKILMSSKETKQIKTTKP